MALAGNVLQTTFAAISFAGAGYLFQHLNSSGYAEEMERHNKALEDLAKAKEVSMKMRLGIRTELNN